MFHTGTRVPAAVQREFPLYNQMMPQHMNYGWYINHMDVQDRRKVCVLGRKVYEELFRNGEDPTGKYIKLYNINFKIIGI